MKKYIIKLLLLLAILLPLQLSAQLPNQIELRKFTTSGMVSFWITPENSKALGFDGSGNPAMLAVGGSSTLAGLSDVGLTSVADLNLLQYDAATSKWKNISGATYALASHTQDWSTITSTPTTLAGYNIVNPEIGAATATSINGAGIFSSLGVIGIGASSTAANRVAGMSGNIAIGASALGAAALTTFDENTAIGKNAMAVMTSTSTGGNTALGSQSMEAMTGGTQNTAIGYESMGQTTANISGVIAIGSSAGRNATANNELFINSQLKSSYANDQTQSIIYGGMASSAASQFLHFNVGYLQLGNSSTASELRLMEPSGSGTNYTGFKSPALAGDVVYTLPAADGASGQALTTNGSGTLSFATVGVSDGDKGDISVSSSGSSWTVDNSAITDAKLAGSIDPSKITGTAAVLTGAAFTGASSVTLSALGTTTTAGASLINSTSATSGNQQVSPALLLRGNGWKTNSTAASQTVDFTQDVLPVEGAANPSGRWRLRYGVNGAAVASVMEVDSLGAIYLPNGGPGAVSKILEFSSGFITIGGGTTVASPGVFLAGPFYPGNSGAGSLVSDGAGNIAMRGYFDPTMAQEFSIYKTDSGANDELAKIGWRSTADTLVIETVKTGTGTARPIVIRVDGTDRITISATGKITLNGLQTSAGATGELFNDGGFIKVSP